MKHIFIVNPAAGKSDRTAEYREMIDAAFAPRGLSYELLVSNAPGECRTLARQAAQSGEEVRLYACGGDGTLNEVVNGVVGYGNAAVTHFPGGSGNDTIKIFDDPAAFTSIERLLDEVLALPSDKAAEIAVRTQQVIAEETGVTNVADPLGGSWYVEALTDRIEAQAEEIFAQIRELGAQRHPDGAHPIGPITSGLLAGIVFLLASGMA